MIDLHCHILPLVDDGSSGSEESLLMLAKAAAAGTTVMVATPHANLFSSNDCLAERMILDRIDQLRCAARKENLAIEILPGQEVCLEGNYRMLLQEGKFLSLNSSRYMLVEFDFRRNGKEAMERLSTVQAAGYVPVLAHPERFSFLTKNRKHAHYLKENGILLQINSGSLFGEFGENAHETALWMLENRLADFVASDGHSPYRRIPVLENAHEYISERFSIEYADFLLESNPNNLLHNKILYNF